MLLNVGRNSLNEKQIEENYSKNVSESGEKMGFSKYQRGL
jgi:hypothetical protein